MKSTRRRRRQKRRKNNVPLCGTKDVAATDFFVPSSFDRPQTRRPNESQASSNMKLTNLNRTYALNNLATILPAACA